MSQARSRLVLECISRMHLQAPAPQRPNTTRTSITAVHHLIRCQDGRPYLPGRMNTASTCRRALMQLALNVLGNTLVGRVGESDGCAQAKADRSLGIGRTN